MTNVIKQNKKTATISLLIIIVSLSIFLYAKSTGSTTRDVKTFTVTRDLFEVKITETGELKAIKSVLVSSPRIRNKLQIVKLAEEGSMINEGDTLIEFDNAELQKAVSNQDAELEKALADLEKARAEEHILVLELDKTILQAELELATAVTDLKIATHSATAEKETAEKTVVLKRRSLEIAKLRKGAELSKQKADIRKLELTVDQAREELELAKAELDLTLIKAPISGMVVFQEVWKGGTMEKVQEGDTPWSGQGLIRIPNLEKMLVETFVNEVDISKVAKRQEVVVTLDAFPKPPLKASVTKISTLATEHHESDAKVYEVIAELDTTKPEIRPGMTATCDIIIERIEDAVFLPQITVFEKEDTTIVYKKKGGGFVPVPVETGRRNRDMVIIENGVTEGDEVALRDPTIEIKESEWMSEEPSGKDGGWVPDKDTRRRRKRTFFMRG